MPSQEALDKDPQLALYQLGLGKRYGEDSPIELVWHYVSRSMVRRSTRTPEQLEGLKTATISTIDRIRSEERYEPHKNALCDWCEFRSLCPAWNPHAPPPSAPRRAAPTLPSTDPEQLSLL